MVSIQQRIVNLPESFKGVRASNVRVENKERGIVFAENLSSESERSGWNQLERGTSVCNVPVPNGSVSTLK
jgi:hypothetical protein